MKQHRYEYSGNTHPFDKSRKYKKKRIRKTDAEATRYIGIDGEGQGRKNHRYILLAASTIDGSDSWHITPRVGMGHDHLKTEDCLDMILSLPSKRTKIFSYAFNYDITKMVADLPDESLFLLFRPDLRQRERHLQHLGPIPVEWTSPFGQVYFINLQGTKFTIASEGKRTVIWDLFKFFQAKFVNALKDWQVGNEALWARMQVMKDKRDEFDKESMPSIIAYCLEECRCMAELGKKLIEAHRTAGLLLRSYYGAGSSGAAMLTVMGIKEKLAKTQENMRQAVGAAFFGGRFENSVIGPIREPLTNWDISSAYPYQLTFLPCLEHASWTHTKRRNDIEKAEAQSGALIRYVLRANAGIRDWGPFPYRTPDGTISFPAESAGGWVWLSEYLAGEKMFPNIQFKEAWVYSSNCNCKPFRRIPEFYNLRQTLGKEGAGIVIKLGTNSCYGKLAQSVGNPKFNSWIWAGMITSGCRAQLLELMALHKDRRNVLMMATDGLVTRETIVPPIPLETGTGSTGKPLGGWEKKDVPKGMFIARPGIYFPMDPTEDEIKQVRARGVGRSVVLQYWQDIVATWQRDGIKGIAEVANVTRFCGGKTSISVSRDNVYKRASGINGGPSYGQWITRKVQLGFDPMPKRAGLNRDGVTLTLRRFPVKGNASAPYKKSLMAHSPDAKALAREKDRLLEQPDGDLSDYEVE